MNDLKVKNTLLYSTAQSLKQLKYPDPERVSKEICEHSRYDSHLIKNILNSLQNDEPWEYIRGYTVFYGNKIYVDPNVLIPRVETEILIDEIITNLSEKEGITEFVDVGTGSGCIILSLYQRLKSDSRNSFTALERSKKALKVAERNFDHYEAEIALIHSDLLKNYMEKRADQIVFIANLPYLTNFQLENADDSVSVYEPKEALLGGGDKGLDIIDRFILEASEIKTPHTIYLEIDPSQFSPINKDLPKRYKIIDLIKDQFDRDRFLHLESK